MPREVAEHARRVIEIRDGHIVTDPGPQMADEDPQAVHSWTARRGRVSELADGLEAAQDAPSRVTARATCCAPS